MKQQVSYFNVAEFPGWKKAPAFLEAIIASRNPEVVLEIGCGPNPTLPLFNSKEIRYIISDLEEHELKKAPEGYERRVLDMEGERMPEDLLGSCDLVFSRMVNEHVKDGKKYHQNIFDVLKPGGIAVHCFSTLYALPFLVNRVSPNFVADKLLDVFSPRDREYHDRFPAYYS
jgi:SAM-dependent methyltransferase